MARSAKRIKHSRKPQRELATAVDRLSLGRLQIPIFTTAFGTFGTAFIPVVKEKFVVDVMSFVLSKQVPVLADILLVIQRVFKSFAPEVVIGIGVLLLIFIGRAVGRSAASGNEAEFRRHAEELIEEHRERRSRLRLSK